MDDNGSTQLVQKVWDLLADPNELVRIWAADCWLMNLDRSIYGNILMVADTQGRFHLLAADQSDSFLGSGPLADGSCFGRARNSGAAPYVPLLERVFLERGCGALEEMVGRIRTAAESIPIAVRAVPAEWWTSVGASPTQIMRCLRERADRIHDLVDLDRWRGLSNATQGGLRL